MEDEEEVVDNQVQLEPYQNNVPQSPFDAMAHKANPPVAAPWIPRQVWTLHRLATNKPPTKQHMSPLPTTPRIRMPVRTIPGE